nr:CMF_HP1_G0006610.mRNA.1.CDS.1 [Saccharomyces cerevisiae]
MRLHTQLVQHQCHKVVSLIIVWLVGDKLTIADLAFVPWNNVVDRIGINIKIEFPEVYKWTKHRMRRPAVIKALRGE